ncbi:hypothetical protein [Nesterenkonia sp. Act20]|uniref:hypothetical protein n=1 Tax=Nesterenkonia sp. Act20 TaxID=1483432 RepID=UPI001C476078|nr:hypothetical protein [Nesterenkonia sp. Act20]
MTFFPSSSASAAGAPPRRARAGITLGLLAMVLLTGCETATVEDSTEPAADAGTSAGDSQAQAPEPTGNQLSHEEMRAQLEARYPEATLTDTDDYWSGLRDIETELQKLVVDPPECKQYVVRSAVPVPAGALVAFADGSGGSAGSAPGGEAETGGDAETGDAEPEASDSGSGAAVQLASTEEDSADGSDSEDSDGEESSGDSAEDADTEDSEQDGEDSEEEPEPVTVDLPAERQAVIYTFPDWRAAESHFTAEQDGLDECDSYTAQRSADDAVETSTSIDRVDLTSEADAAFGITRRISSAGENEHSAAVTLRTGSHIVTVMVPLQDSLSEEEAEVAVVELEEEAADLLASLD